MSEIKNFIKKYDSTYDLINALKDNFLKVKENDDLLLIRYNRGLSDLSKDFIRQSRGIIIEKNTHEIISFPIIGGIDFEHFKNKVDWEDCVIEESIDGTMIVLYYYNNSWNISTKTSLDGKCYWNNKTTFYDLFIDTSKKIGLNYDILNKNFCYTFVLCHPECRNITDYKFPDIYHVSSRNLQTLVEIDEEIGIKKPLILKLNKYNKLKVNNYNELFKSLDDLNYNCEGYMLYSKDRKYRVKLKSNNHKYVHELKGNYPNITQKLLELSNDVDKNEFLKYFPEYKVKINSLDENIDKLSRKIHILYSDVKKKKLENIEIPKIYSKIIVLLHNEYHNLMNKYRPEHHSYKPNITFKKVKHFIVNSIEKSYLAAMLNTI